MQCEKCGGDMWDNRSKKASGKFKSTSPDYSCKNPDCKHAVWLEKPKQQTKVATIKTTIEIDKVRVLELAHKIVVDSKDNQNLWDDIVAQAGQIENLLKGKITTQEPDEEI